MLAGRRPFEVAIDHDREIITIQGIQFTFGYFDALATSPKGARFEVGDRIDGAVTLHTIEQDKPINVTVNVTGNADAAQQLRSTAYQIAQSIKRAIR